MAERIRELSTIKVLGFYDKEVTLYIYRETILLSLLGILAGFGVGDLLYHYILAVVPPDEVMFNPALCAKAFVIPAILIAVITFILGYIMNRKLKYLDMLSALKICRIAKSLKVKGLTQCSSLTYFICTCYLSLNFHIQY